MRDGEILCSVDHLPSLSIFREIPLGELAEFNEDLVTCKLTRFRVRDDGTLTSHVFYLRKKKSRGSEKRAI
jgi:hypothetical protein